MNLFAKAPLPFIAGLSLALAACSGDEGTTDAGNANPNPDAGVVQRVTALTLSPNPAMVAIGGSVQLTATGTLEDGTTADVTRRADFESSNLDIALVDFRGLAFGAAEGSSRVTATIDGVSAAVTVEVSGMVTPPPPDDLPMIVDDNFPGRAGFGESGPSVHTEDANCPTRAGSEAGVCHHFTWDGTGGAFTGVFWVNGDGFDSIAGVDVAAGATDVSFYAWGVSGGEVIEVGAGINDRDGAEARGTITLTTTPTKYTVSLAALGAYGPVFGGFIWAADNTNNPNGAEFYIDDIQWIEDTTAPTGIPLPMVVDDNYTGRSAFGPDGPPLHTEDDQCPMRAGGQAGVCHRFVWDGTGGGFTGTVWTDGDGFQNLNGKEVEAGATEVQFYAWCANGGEVLEFGAGIGEPALDVNQVRTNLTMTTAPAQYSVSLAALGDYGPVFGAFVFAANNTANPTGVTCYVDDIRWVKGEAPTSIALPMTVDAHYQGRSAFGPDGPPLHTEDTMCPTRPMGAVGDCHRFVWDGTGGAFTGTFFTDGDSFMNLNGPVVDAGATEVSFYAWGAAGGEMIEFGAGLSPQDGGEAREVITLTTTPTMYTVSIAALGNYSSVFGPFIWAASTDNNPSGATFYVDSIQWVAGTPPMAIPLPMTLDDHFPGRSGFGPNGPPLHTEDAMCPMRAGGMNGDCHRFVWDGSGGDFTGTFWTDGDGFVDLIGNAVAAGATQVRFYAWGATGGEVIEVGAGIGDSNRDGAEARSEITLTTTPTEYTVSLAPLSGYSLVYGPFIWAANTGNNPTGVTFYVDDLQWVAN